MWLRGYTIKHIRHHLQSSHIQSERSKAEHSSNYLVFLWSPSDHERNSTPRRDLHQTDHHVMTVKLWKISRRNVISTVYDLLIISLMCSPPDSSLSPVEQQKTYVDRERKCFLLSSAESCNWTFLLFAQCCCSDSISLCSFRCFPTWQPPRRATNLWRCCKLAACQYLSVRKRADQYRRLVIRSSLS